MRRFSYAAFLAAFLFLAFRLSEAADIGEVQVNAPPEPVSAEKPSAFISVIDPKPFVNQVKTLPELLSQQPGVNVQEFGGLGQLSTVSIRGSTAEQVTVLIDGVKINTAQGGAVDFSSIPLDAIDHIEIIRGGASAQFGSDAIGGAINIITRKIKRKQSIESAFGVGSFRTIKTTEGYSKGFDKWSILFDHTHLSSSGDFTFISTPTNIGGVTIGGGQEFTRENNAFYSENGLLKLEGDPNERIRIGLTTDWFGSQRQVPPTEDEQILLSPANPPQAHENILQNLTTISTDFRSLWLKDLDLRFQPFYRYQYNHFQDPSPALGGEINVKYFNQSFGGKLAWSYPLKTGAAEQYLHWGFDIREDLFHDDNLIVPTQVAGPHQRTTPGISVSDEISLLRDRLAFNPSLRFEHASDFGSKVALHFGVRGNPLSWMTIKANVENSFRYPNFNELFLPNEGIFRGNPNLIPEEAINWDGGFVFHHPFGRTEIDYFGNRIDNSIIWVPISAFTIAPLNTNRVNAQGMEFSTHLSPWKHLDFEANYTLLLAHFVNSGNQLPGRPKQKANARVTLKNDWGSIYANLLYIDRLPIDFANTTFIVNRAQLDLGATLKVKKNYYFALEVKDVTNIQMLDAQGFPLPRLNVMGSFGIRI